MLRNIFIAVLLLVTNGIYAQGIPKAYEDQVYINTLNGMKIKLMLADGYVAYSDVQLPPPHATKPFIFEPDSGAPGDDSTLKFIPNNTSRHDYFILNNMQDSYDEPPKFIVGKYFNTGKPPMELKLKYIGPSAK